MKNVVCNVVKMGLGTVVMLMGMGVTPAQAASFSGGAGCSGTQLSLGVILDSKCSLDVGDKRFSNFTASLTQNGDADPDAYNQISLTAVDGVSPGFDISSGFFAGLNSFVDLDLRYNVLVTDAAQWLSGVTLAFNGKAQGTGRAQITETVFDITGTTQLGPRSAFVDKLKLTDSISFDPVKQAFISKNILLRGGTGELSDEDFDGQSFASVSFVRNQHNQVPTPALLPGLIGLGVTAWRKRRQAAAIAIAA
jgi:hypothetical protein